RLLRLRAGRRVVERRDLVSRMGLRPDQVPDAPAERMERVAGGAERPGHAERRGKEHRHRANERELGHARAAAHAAGGLHEPAQAVDELIARLRPLGPELTLQIRLTLTK